MKKKTDLEQDNIKYKMKIKLTGSSGYLGTLISKKLRQNGHQTEGIPRDLYKQTNELQTFIKEADVIINLAGSPILTQWTEEKKKEIYNSRVKTTTHLVEAINGLAPGEKPKTLVSASAIGIYKAGKEHDEESTEFDEGFVGKVVFDWEKALEPLDQSVQKIIFRIAPVLGKNSETVKNLKLPFKMGIGGKIGDGKQPFPFVHEKDVADAFLWAVEVYDGNGIFNLAAPDNITNKTFTKTFASKMNRPSVVPVPGFGLKMIYGEAANMLIESPEVKPKELQNAGFHFSYPDIDSALSEILE